MKKYIYIFAICFILTSCLIRGVFKPKDFTYLYTPSNTGLDLLLNIDGCFITNDTSRLDFRYLVFWKSNLACLSYILPTENMFPKKENKYIWATYIIEGTTIKIQNVLDTGADGGIVVNPYTFEINNPNELILMDKKDSSSISSKNVFSYMSLENRIDSTNWLLKKRWFYE